MVVVVTETRLNESKSTVKLNTTVFCTGSCAVTLRLFLICVVF